jgi:peptidoglycan/xylan/chitin deacetylase (PgdA/CDA1 family)
LHWALALVAAALVALAPQPSGTGSTPPPKPDAGAAPPAVIVKGVVYHGPRTAKRVALTFDACSVPNENHVDEGVLDALTKLNVPATLFLGGLWMEDQRTVVERLKQNPAFELQSHAYHHPHLTKLGTAAIQAEIDQSQTDFEQLVGHKATLMRAPYGEIDARVAAILLKSGVTPIQFDLASGDPDKSFTKKRLVKWVVNHSQPGGIVVMHMNGRGWHTAESLPDIVAGLRAKGFELVRVSDLLSPSPTPAASPAPDAGPR